MQVPYQRNEYRQKPVTATRRKSIIVRLHRLLFPCSVAGRKPARADPVIMEAPVRTGNSLTGRSSPENSNNAAHRVIMLQHANTVFCVYLGDPSLRSGRVDAFRAYWRAIFNVLRLTCTTPCICNPAHTSQFGALQRSGDAFLASRQHSLHTSSNRTAFRVFLGLQYAPNLYFRPARNASRSEAGGGFSSSQQSKLLKIRTHCVLKGGVPCSAPIHTGQA